MYYCIQVFFKKATYSTINIPLIASATKIYFLLDLTYISLSQGLALHISIVQIYKYYLNETNQCDNDI